MELQIDLLVTDVQELIPFVSTNEIKTLVSQMSQRSKISEEKLLLFLKEELQKGVPFRYTSVGKSRAWVFL